MVRKIIKRALVCRLVLVAVVAKPFLRPARSMETDRVEFVVSHDDPGLTMVGHRLDRMQSGADAAGAGMAGLGIDQVAEKQGATTSRGHVACAIVTIAESRQQGFQLVEAAMNVGDDVEVDSDVVHARGD